jgi:hypothetical protein
MTTSGSIDFSVSRDSIITESLMIIGVLSEGETPSTSQLSDHSRALNMMVKAWQTRGLNLWSVQKLSLVLEQDKTSYTLGTDHITSSLTRTALASDAASGASTISVDSITGISNLYNIGVKLDDGTMQWTTVNGAPSGTTVTLTAVLTGTASEDNVVYVYATKYNALGVKESLQAYRRTEDEQDSTINIISRDEYNMFSDKQAEGKVTHIQFQPNLTSSVFYVYPMSDTETDTIEIMVKRTLEDFDAAADTPDFPQTWYEALCYNLAFRLSHHYKLPVTERQELAALAEKMLMDAESGDAEHQTSTYMQIDKR